MKATVFCYNGKDYSSKDLPTLYRWMFHQFDLLKLPNDLIDFIIRLTKNNVSELCIVNRYFGVNVKKLRISHLTPKYVKKIPFKELKTMSPYITSANLNYDKRLTNKHVKYLSNLTSLQIQFNENINNNTIKLLTNLTSLHLEEDQMITDKSLSLLTNLKHLYVGPDHPGITNNAISLLTNLTSLSYEEDLLDITVLNLTNLTYLDLGGCGVANETNRSLPKLQMLNLSGNNVITNETLGSLTNLTWLSLNCNYVIHDSALLTLTNLKTLDLGGNDEINISELTYLTNLTTLGLYGNDEITNKMCSIFPNLVNIERCQNLYFSL